MKYFNVAAAVAVFVTSLFAFATPAQAKPGAVAHEGADCPTDWGRGGTQRVGYGDRAFCYALKENSPEIERRASTNDSCPSGMSPADKFSLWCWSREQLTVHEDTWAQGDKIAKPRDDIRCPTGWITYSDHQQCYTMVANPPKVRASNGKPCKAGELNDFNAWCTAGFEGLTYDEVDVAGTNDFNVTYTHMLTLGKQPLSFDSLSDDAKAFFASKAPAKAAGSGSKSQAQSSEAATAQCDTSGTGSANGAAIGGAVAGDAGAVLGSVLGGLGKKKKKKNAC